MEGGSRSVSAGSPNGLEGPRVMSVSLSRIGLLALERTEQSALFGLITMLFFAEKPHPISITRPPAIWKDLVQNHIFLMRNYIQFVRNSDTISFLSVRNGAWTVRPTRPMAHQRRGGRTRPSLPRVCILACACVTVARVIQIPPSSDPPSPPPRRRHGPAAPGRIVSVPQGPIPPARSAVSYRSEELA